MESDAKIGRNQDVSFITAPDSSLSLFPVEVPKETSPNTETPFDRQTWKLIEELEDASASDFRAAVEEGATEVVGATQVSLSPERHISGLCQ